MIHNPNKSKALCAVAKGAVITERLGFGCFVVAMISSVAAGIGVVVVDAGRRILRRLPALWQWLTLEHVGILLFTALCMLFAVGAGEIIKRGFDWAKRYKADC